MDSQWVPVMGLMLTAAGIILIPVSVSLVRLRRDVDGNTQTIKEVQADVAQTLADRRAGADELARFKLDIVGELATIKANQVHDSRTLTAVAQKLGVLD